VATQAVRGVSYPRARVAKGQTQWAQIRRGKASFELAR
jgi:hypothetical protein